MKGCKTIKELDWEKGDRLQIIFLDDCDKKPNFNVGDIVYLYCEYETALPLCHKNSDGMGDGIFLYTKQLRKYEGDNLVKTNSTDVLVAIKEFVNTASGGEHDVAISKGNNYSVMYHGQFEYIAKSDERLLEILDAIAVLEKE